MRGDKRQRVGLFGLFKCFIERLTQLQRLYSVGKGKGKSDPLQAWSGPEGFRKLRFPDFMPTAVEDGKVVNLRHRPPLPAVNKYGTRFC